MTGWQRYIYDICLPTVEAEKGKEMKTIPEGTVLLLRASNEKKCSSCHRQSIPCAHRWQHEKVDLPFDECGLEGCYCPPCVQVGFRVLDPDNFEY
jgi:hypothetical protein